MQPARGVQPDIVEYGPAAALREGQALGRVMVEAPLQAGGLRVQGHLVVLGLEPPRGTEAVPHPVPQEYGFSL